MKKLLPILILVLVVFGAAQTHKTPENSQTVNIIVEVQAENLTILMIAEKYGVDPLPLAEANNIRPNQKLKKGSTIIIPARLIESLFKDSTPTTTPNPYADKTFEEMMPRLSITPTPSPTPDAKTKTLPDSYIDDSTKNIKISEPIKTETESKYLKPTAEPTMKLLPESCSIGLSDIPRVRNLRLGMSRTAIPTVFTGCAFSTNSTCFYRVEDLRNVEIAKGIDAIQIDIDSITNSISTISVIYDDSIKWNTLREFAEIISKSLQIPNNKWVSSKTSKNLTPEILKYACANYIVQVTMIDDLRPQLTISKSETLIKFEQNLIQQEKKKEFKP